MHSEAGLGTQPTDADPGSQLAPGSVGAGLKRAGARVGAPERAKVVIEPGKRWGAKPHDLWEYREVLYFLFLRNLKIRYRQAVLGATWAVLQPLALMGVFVVVVGKLIKVSSEGAPYPLFAFAALVPWGLLSQSLTQASESIVRDINLVSKLYVPRLILPLASIGALLIDFLIALGILFVMMLAYSVPPDPTAAFWIPVLAGLTLVVATAVGVWLSALMVMYRDVRAIVPLLVQVWLFATPVAYPSTLVPERWRVVYGLNPMAGIVDGFRSALIGTPAPSPGMLAASAGVAFFLLAAGLAYFRKVDRIFADVI